MYTYAMVTLFFKVVPTLQSISIGWSSCVMRVLNAWTVTQCLWQLNFSKYKSFWMLNEAQCHNHTIAVVRGHRCGISREKQNLKHGIWAGNWKYLCSTMYGINELHEATPSLRSQNTESFHIIILINFTILLTLTLMHTDSHTYAATHFITIFIVLMKQICDKRNCLIKLDSKSVQINIR